MKNRRLHSAAPALAVFVLLLATSLTAAIASYCAQLRYIQADVRCALAQTLAERQSHTLDADTLRVYRSHISQPLVRDTAYIALRQAAAMSADRVTLVAEAGCSAATVLRLSDQRMSGLLAALALLWWLLTGRTVPRTLLPALGGLSYEASQHCFYASNGSEVTFTPMQRRLMEMFFSAPNHRLTQHEISVSLWPGKPDASETLYRLVSRLRPVLDKHTSLRIIARNDASYELRGEANM